MKLTIVTLAKCEYRHTGKVERDQCKIHGIV